MVFTTHTPFRSSIDTKRSEAVGQLASELLLTTTVNNTKDAGKLADSMIANAETRGSSVRETEDYNITITVLREEF